MSLRILIADDASFIREILKSLALQQGWTVCAEAVEGHQAYELALNHEPDIVIMDLVMPRLSGIDAARLILKKKPGTPIIALSTLDDPTLVARAIEAGCISFVAKPFTNRDIIRAVKDGFRATGERNNLIKEGKVG